MGSGVSTSSKAPIKCSDSKHTTNDNDILSDEVSSSKNNETVGIEETETLERKKPFTAEELDIAILSSEDNETGGTEETETFDKERPLTVGELDDDILSDEVSSSEDSETDGIEETETLEQKKPLTTEELIIFKTTVFTNLREKCENALACNPYKNEDGEFVEEIQDMVVNLHNSPFALTRATREEIANYRKDVATLIVETKVIDLLCEIIEWTYKNGWLGSEQSTKFTPLLCSLVVLWNYSDMSSTFAMELASRDNLLQLMKTIIVDYKDRHLGTVEPTLEETEEHVMRSSISIIHNVSNVESNVKALRNVGIKETLQPLLHSKEELISMCALASLAAIINEMECDIIEGNRSIVSNLLGVMKSGLQAENLETNGWSCYESAFTIKKLARNDANKKLLVNLGALELLVDLGRKGNKEEQIESVEAIWALSFDEDIKDLITGNPDLGVIELLMGLKTSEHVKIEEACHGALWTLEDKLKTTDVEKYKLIGEQLAARHKTSLPQSKDKFVGKQDKNNKTIDDDKLVGGHVMISYQWSDQATLKKVRDNIKAGGYKVWMDIDQMRGSTLQAMAEAVEGADIFLMCMSSKYKNSNPCRQEAEYAHKRQKTILPLQMERGYCADGWLGIMLGTKLFYEFSGKYLFEEKMEELLKELHIAMSRNDSVDGGEVIKHSPITATHSVTPVVQSSNPVSSMPSKAFHRVSLSMVHEAIGSIRKWTTTDVSDWITKHNLTGCKVKHLTGGEIALLARMQVECPEYFYKYLQETLRVKDCLTMSKIVWALEDLNTAEHK